MGKTKLQCLGMHLGDKTIKEKKRQEVITLKVREVVTFGGENESVVEMVTSIPLGCWQSSVS